MKSTIRLFRAVPIKEKKTKNPNEELLSETIKRGFVFSPEVIYNYFSNSANYGDLIKLVEREVGLTPEKLNSSFHKSWGKVRDASIEQLVIEQLIHYFTTYGFERLGIYDKDTVYIPKEKLEISEINEDIKLTVIKGYTKKELKEKLLNLLQSGIALNEDTIKDVMNVALFIELNERDTESIKNKEMKIMLYDYLNLIPENPVEFLRYVIYKTINKTLLIKNEGIIEEIKRNITNQFSIIDLFVKYEDKYGYERLAEIFYRFKPLFLAFRANESLKTVINKIRKLAKKYHKPLKEDYLNGITSKIKRKEKINEKELERELSRNNIFRKIRLAYALKFRTKETSSILYKIRNGKGYATNFDFTQHDEAERILDIVRNSIIKDIGKNVKGKKIYIPEYIKYCLPATEKQFTGNYPNGTHISVPADMIMGIHWENVSGHRIDLDLSLISSESGKIGWDSSYRTEDRSILFSGDMTDAPKPKGATELMYVKKQQTGSFILLVNYYNFVENRGVPFKIIVAKERASNFGMNYMVNPNNVISIAKSKISQRQKILGLLVTTADECRFYFAETNLGMSISSSDETFIKHARDYLSDFYENTIDFNNILERAGAEIVNSKENADIDLSELEKDSILSLLK